MSRLTDLVEAKITGRRYGRITTVPAFAVVKENSIPLSDTRHDIGYRVGVEFFSEARIDLSIPGAVDKAKISMGRNIQEFVFGEFRESIYELDRLLYERDIDGAKKELDSLMARMFSV